MVIFQHVSLYKHSGYYKNVMPNYFSYACQDARRRAFGDFQTFISWKSTYAANLMILLVWKIESSPQTRAIFQYLVCFYMFNAFLTQLKKLHFWKVRKIRLKSVHIFNGGLMIKNLWVIMLERDSDCFNDKYYLFADSNLGYISESH